MIKWIEEMNKMFKANPYTDARVTVRDMELNG